MKDDPRTLARYEEEESDLLITVYEWELAGHLTKRLSKRFNGFTFSRSEKVGIDHVEISVDPSPEQMVYNQMQGYAQATYEFLGSILKGE